MAGSSHPYPHERDPRSATYRAAIRPYVRCMVTLSQLYHTCGMEVSPQGAVLIWDPGWTSLAALLLYRACAQAIAALRHAATATEGNPCAPASE